MELLHRYGAMMWSLGKVVQTPEVMRVYLGSFWVEKPPNCFEDCRELIEAESKDLLRDLKELRRNAAIRKINEIVKRARLARVCQRDIEDFHDTYNYLIGTCTYYWPSEEGDAIHVWQKEETQRTSQQSGPRVYEDPTTISPSSW